MSDDERKARNLIAVEKYNEKNKEKIKARRDSYYLKNKEKEKARRAKYRLDNPEKIKAARVKYTINNQDKLKAWDARYKSENREKINEKARVRNYTDPAHRKEIVEKHKQKHPLAANMASKRWRDANPEKAKAAQKKYNEANPEKLKEFNRRWASANPDATRLKNHTRRSRIRNSHERLSKGVVARLFGLQKGICPCCRADLGKYHIDHIMPLALGGSNADTNIQLLCAKCNLQKHSKHPIDFMQSKGFLL